MTPNATPSRGDDHTSFALAIRARDARTSAAIALAGAFPAAFLAFHWHFLVLLPVVSLVVGVDALRRLVMVAGDHARFVADKSHHVTP